MAQYNAQRSLNQEDQLEQTSLYIKLMKEPIEYDKEAFALALSRAPFIYEGRLPLCMKYIHDGAKKDVNPREGLWRLWDPPKDVPTAKEVYELSLKQKKNPKEEERLRHNVNSTLEQRKSPDPDPLDLTLASHIRLNKGKGEKVLIGEELLDKQFQMDKERERAKHEAETKNKGAGKAGSSTDVPERQRSGSSNPVLTPPYKRKAGEPDSPASIERIAKSHWRSFGTKMKRKSDDDYSRRFVKIRGEEHWDIADFIFGLTFQMEDYSPILQRQSNGNLIYEDVPAYDAKWLPKDANKKVVSPSRRISFNPVHVWIEDRWVLSRRLAGDTFCQLIFYYVSEFIWKKNDLPPKQRHNRQEAMLKTLFEIEDTEAWRNEYTKEDSIVPVINWKGDTIVYATRAIINKMVGETCLLGPVAAMYGREFQQFLIEKGDRTTIRVAQMQKSVDSGRASLSTYRIKTLHTESVNKSTKGTTSQARNRSRTPSRDQGARGQAQAPWRDNRRYSHPTSPRNDQKKSSYDARTMDIRYRDDFHRLQQQKDNQKEIERLQQEQDRLRQQERIRDSRERARRMQHRDSSRPEERRNSRSNYRSYHRDERPRNQYQSDYNRPRRSYHKDDYRPRRYD